MKNFGSFLGREEKDYSVLKEAKGRKTIELKLSDPYKDKIVGKKNTILLIDLLKQLDGINQTNHYFQNNDILKIIKDNGYPVKLAQMLKDEGWIVKEGKKFKLTDKAVEAIVNNEVGLTPNVKLKKVTKSVTKRMNQRIKKYKVPANIKSTKTDDLLRIIFSNMLAQLQNKMSTGILIAGNPGTGKTSTIRMIAKLFGMNLVTIEAPHITEENLISIPYIIFDSKGKEQTDVMQVDTSTSDYKLVYAESNLVTKLKKMKPLKENQWQTMIKNNPMLKMYYEKYKSIIEKVRRNSEADKIGFSTILFLDEYYRRPSQKIGNILRGIMDGKIGSDKIPNDVYVIYASNISDSTGDVEAQMEHEEFIQVDFDDVKKEEFAQYIANKFTPVDVQTGEEDVNKEIEYEIDPDIYNAFSEALPEELGGEPEQGLRMSPRRTEQTLLFIDSSLSKNPPKNVEEVRAILTYVKNLYTDYTTNETNPEYNKIKKVILDYVRKNTDIKVGEDLPELPVVEWRKQFEIFIKTKETLGENMAITPVLSSVPGQGKTSIIKSYAKNNNQGLIYINAQEIRPDDVIGIPIPNRKEKNIETAFSQPPLLEKIMKEYNELIEIYKEEGRRYNVILFIDEFSRTDPKVFNAIRMMMLEHKITSEYSLPEDMLVVCAMNPNGEGTTEISEHMKDVINVIPSGLSWKDLMSYLISQTETLYEDEFKIAPVLRNYLSSIATDFASQYSADGELIPPEMQNYYWEVLDNVIIYMSPRVITSTYNTVIYSVPTDIQMEIGETPPNFENLDKAKIQKITDIIVDSWKRTIPIGFQNQIRDKNNLEKSDWNKVKKKLISRVDDFIDEIIQSFAIIKSKVSQLFSAMEIYQNVGTEKFLKFNEDELLLASYVQYLKNVEGVQSVIADMSNVWQALYSNKEIGVEDLENVYNFYKLLIALMPTYEEIFSKGDIKLLKMTLFKSINALMNIEQYDFEKDCDIITQIGIFLDKHEDFYNDIMETIYVE